MSRRLCRQFPTIAWRLLSLDRADWLLSCLLYTSELQDAYYSIVEALDHAGIALGLLPEIEWISSEELEGISDEEIDKRLAGVDAVIVPSGFGARGMEGMIAASRSARELKIPFFGIGLGMQMAMVDIARHVAGLSNCLLYTSRCV